MKINRSFRHAAAIALVGWYLMVPPRICQPGGNMVEGNTVVIQRKSCIHDAGRPLNEWQVEYTYDAAADCEEDKDGLQHGTLFDRVLLIPASAKPVVLPPAFAKKVATPEYRKMTAAKFAEWQARVSYRCVASDDPRLKN